MAATSHISVGKVGATATKLMLHPNVETGRTRVLANPMAQKISQGSSKYQDQEQWSYLEHTDWQGGIGRIKPGEDGGYLYGDLDSRVPEQLILPPLLHMSDRRDIDATIADCRFMPEDIAGVLGAGTYAIKFTTPAAFVGTVSLLRIYANVANTAGVTIEFFSDSADAPNASISGSATFIDSGNAGGQWNWYSVGVTDSTFATATSYWVRLIVPSGAQVAYASSGYARVAMQFSAGAWANLSNKYILHSIDFFRLDDASTVEYQGGVFRLASDLYLFHRNDIYKYSSANDNWTSVGSAGSGNITGAVVLGSSVFLSKDSGDFYTMTDAEVIAASSGGENASRFTAWAGVLWRADGASLYYSSDGTTWTQITDFPTGYNIRGMAGMGDYVYVATDEALYRIYGTSVAQATRFGTVDSINGQNMIHHNGNLYIPVNNRIFEFGESGAMRDIWTRPENLPLKRAGLIHSLYSTNNWLLALTGVTGSVSLGTPSVPLIWAYQGDGWHPMVVLPCARAPSFTSYNRTRQAIFYDRTLDRLWYIDGRGVTWWITTTDYALNPYYDTSYKFMPYGWLEYDWFDGDIRELNKDIESLTIIGESIAAANPIKAYWQDDASTDWELLGTFDSNTETIRWSDYTTRPRTKRLKLGFQLSTLDADVTPRIQAIILRYQTHLKDRYRWQFTIICYDNQTGTNGELLSLTRAQMEAALDQLEGTDTSDEQTAPFILTDVNGNLYEVKVLAASQMITDLDKKVGDSTDEYATIYQWTLEQATTGEYTP
jgi:hypothetical protein